MKRLLLFLVLAGSLSAQHYMPIKTGEVIQRFQNQWRVRGAGVLASRPATCTANRDAWVCNGTGCFTNGEIHYCTSTNTWTVTGGSTWISYTVAYTATEFKAADTDASVDLFTLPADGIIEAIRIKHSVAFAGTAVTSVVCSVGDASGDTGDDDAYMPPFNVFQTVGATVGGYDGGAYSTTAAEQTVQLHCVANTDFGSGSATVLTAGSVNVTVKWAVIP